MNIIQRSSTPTYQQVFTLLLQTYRAKYILQKVQLRDIRQIKDTKLSQLSFKLRSRLIWFADILRSYLTETVIALSTEDMLAAMSKTEDIDEMSTIHVKYVARLQEQSLLAENLKPIHSAIISLLDLSVLFHDTLTQQATSETASVKLPPKSLGKPVVSRNARRKSVIPAIVEDVSTDSECEDGLSAETPTQPKRMEQNSFAGNLSKIDEDFSRLLLFVTAGLRNIGRVGAEPVWEMLAERLEWDRR
jgi:gamma-tubulin complex component 5